MSPAEKLALKFAALLPPDQVSLPWLRSLVAKTFPEMERDAEPGYLDPWKNVLRRLFSLHLLRPTGMMDNDGQPLVGRVHRLLQELMLRDCPAEEWFDRQLAVAGLVSERVALSEETTPGRIPRWELEPITALAGLWEDTMHPRAVWLLSHAGVPWLHLAEWSQAEPLLRRALALAEASLGARNPYVTTNLNNLAALLQATNRRAEAEPLLRRALAIHEACFGLEHPAVAINLSSLGGLLNATNRLAEAEPLWRRALAIDEISFGPENPEVAIDLRNLAGLLKATNRYVPPDGYGMAPETDRAPRTGAAPNGHSGNGNGSNGAAGGGNGYHRPAPQSDRWNCTDGQKGLVIRLVHEHQLDKNDVEAMAQQLFGCTVTAMDKMQASQLIEDLLEKVGKKPSGQRRWGNRQGVRS